MVARGSLSSQGMYTKNNPESMGKGEITNLNGSSTFEKVKEVSSSWLGYCKVEKRHTSLRILPQEEERSMEQIYP